MKRTTLFLLFILLLVPALTLAKSQTATVTVDVNAGQHKAVRLKNLPRDSVVQVDISCDGAVTVLFIAEEQYQKYPNISRPLFQSTVRDRINFTVRIPATGNYHLVLDNGTGSRVVKAAATISGSSGPDADLLQSERRRDQGDAVPQDLIALGAELRKIFIFKSFPITAKQCGKESALSRSDGVVLCLEFVKAVFDTMGSEEKAATVLLFASYHEIGHALLTQWGYPFYDNEESADEFAAMLFVLLRQGERLSALAEHFLSNPTSAEMLTKAAKGGHAPLPIERARDILRWLKDSDRHRRWQVIFVPHMQTAVLQRIRKTPPSWADSALVEKELALRTGTTF